MINNLIFFKIKYYRTEVESLRTSLASRTSAKTHFEVLGLEASSPWPWPQSLKSSKIALFSARGQHYFLNSRNFVGKRLKPRGNFAKTFFCFPHLEHRRSRVGGKEEMGAGSPAPLPQFKFHQKRRLFLQFQFLFSIFRLQQ